MDNNKSKKPLTIKNATHQKHKDNKTKKINRASKKAVRNQTNGKVISKKSHPDSSFTGSELQRKALWKPLRLAAGILTIILSIFVFRQSYFALKNSSIMPSIPPALGFFTGFFMAGGGIFSILKFSSPKQIALIIPGLAYTLAFLISFGYLIVMGRNDSGIMFFEWGISSVIFAMMFWICYIVNRKNSNLASL